MGFRSERQALVAVRRRLRHCRLVDALAESITLGGADIRDILDELFGRISYCYVNVQLFDNTTLKISSRKRTKEEITKLIDFIMSFLAERQ